MHLKLTKTWTTRPLPFTNLPLPTSLISGLVFQLTQFRIYVSSLPFTALPRITSPPAQNQARAWCAASFVYPFLKHRKSTTVPYTAIRNWIAYYDKKTLFIAEILTFSKRVVVVNKHQVSFALLWYVFGRHNYYLMDLLRFCCIGFFLREILMK